MNVLRLSIIIIFILFFGFAHPQKVPNLYKSVDPEKMEIWVDSVFDSMSLDERIGQLFIIVTDPGTTSHTTNQVLKYIENQKIGGILFSGGSLGDQAASTNLYQKASKIPLLISFDGEWGLSMRLSGTPRFPKNILLGAVTDNQLIHNYGEEMGRECRKLGVHVNFAPVLDVNNNPSNPVIGTRSFGEDPQDVSVKGIAYAKGLEQSGIIAVGKHFPGHGDTSEDSHKTLPVISHNQEHLNETEFYPFKKFIDEGFSGIMTGHLSVPALDSTNTPTSLSPKIVNDLLKKKLGFEGLAFTDALDMKGAGSGSICVQALLAGNDVLLKPAKPIAEFDSVKKAIEDGILDIELIEEKCLKILRYKYIAGLNEYAPIETDKLYSHIHSNYSKWLIQKLNAEGMTLLKNEGAIIPVKDLAKTKIAVLSLGTDNETTFEKTLGLYAGMNCFQIPRNAKETTANSVFGKMENYDMIICAVHSERMPDYAQLQKLGANKKVILVFFSSPYSMRKFRQNIASSKGVVMAYENTTHAQEAAAQLIMGGIPAKGKLPVTVTGLFKAGTGLKTDKTRLSYFEPREAGISFEKLQKIDDIARKGIKEKAYPGCQILIARNGVVIYNKSFGYFDYAQTHPVAISDVYDLASVTKVTATLPAVMKLYDTGKITLQDNLSTYVPVLKNTDKKEITIKSALFHQSGLAPFLPFYRMAIDDTTYTGSLYSSKRDLTYRVRYDDNIYMRTDFEFKPGLVSKTPKPGYELQAARNFYLNNKFKDMVLKEIADSKLRNNTRYVYSDLNFMLLKEVVENVSKRKLDEFVENEFFVKLGANYTLFNPLKRIDTLKIAPTDNDEFLRGQILIGFVEDEAAAFMGGVSGHAGLFSNANDLAKLLQMYLNEGIYGNERFLSEATCKLFTKAKSPISRRGLGFDKPDKENNSANVTGKLVPASTYGHTGFTGTCFWIDPDNQLIYIFLSNRVYPYRGNKKLSQMSIRTGIQDIIYKAFE
ncbi:MAG: serine hydrolase [Dysgonamonadaceae bacterium]|jgi:beta-glucosidase-like glycosyl hydrolase/CubicO group peptidase (beta-lactamase class C family)|nr:serine hydrolase [Dysgonamonadaceae bacterium]